MSDKPATTIDFPQPVAPVQSVGVAQSYEPFFDDIFEWCRDCEAGNRTPHETARVIIAHLTSRMEPKQ